MNRARRVVVFAVVAIAALCAGYLLGPGGRGNGVDIKPLMAASIPDLQGRPRSLGEWRGSVLVVNFWATWCPPCLKEIPEFVRMQDKLGHRGLQFVGIAADQPEKVREFAAKYKINYPVLLAEMDIIEIASRAGNKAGGLPFTVIVDRRGKWVRSESGALDEQKLSKLLEPLL
ncbi:MAG TPA: TlpA disulfide reductase family protein [Burkholderiales bacterium]